MIIDLISTIYSSTLLCSWFIKFVASTRADHISLHPGYFSMGPTVWGSENRGFGPKVSDFDFSHSTDTSRFDCGPCASTAQSTDFGRCSRALGFFWVPRATQVSHVVAVFAPCTYPDYCSSASLLQLVSNRRCCCYLCVHVAYVRYPYLQPHRPSCSPQHHTTFLTLHVQLDRHVPWCMCMSLCMIDASAWFWNLCLSPGYTESSVFFFRFERFVCGLHMPNTSEWSPGL